MYKERWKIERTNAWIDGFKAVLIHFDTTVFSWKKWNYPAFIVIILKKFLISNQAKQLQYFIFWSWCNTSLIIVKNECISDFLNKNSYYYRLFYITCVQIKNRSVNKRFYSHQSCTRWKERLCTNVSQPGLYTLLVFLNFFNRKYLVRRLTVSNSFL